MFRLQILIVVGLLLAAATSLFIYKATALDFPLSPDTTQSEYYLEARISFAGQGGPVSVEAATPRNSGRFVVVDQDVVAPGFGVLESSDERGDRLAFQRRSLTGPATVFYRVRGYRIDSSNLQRGRSGGVAPDPTYSDAIRARELQASPDAFITALDLVIEQARAESVSDATLVQTLAQLLSSAGDDRIDTLIEAGPTDLREPERRLELALNAAGVPARRVIGVLISDEARTQLPETWVEAHFDNRWNRLATRSGEIEPERPTVPLVFGNGELISAEGARDPSIAFSVRTVTSDRLERALWASRSEAPALSWFSLFSLPLDTQIVFRVLFLLPIGALVIAFMRQVVGVSTFGTFMPVLIALSFRETGLISGIVLFVGLVAAGLVLRAYFSRMHLLLVPRLTAVLVIVTLLMAAIALIAHAAGVRLGLSIALFPLVILTMTIERMSLTWEEAGARSALIRGAGSIASAIVAYLIISNDQIEYLAFVFPEILLIVLGLAILLGSYNGYKLSEYLRFNMFGEASPPKQLT